MVSFFFNLVKSPHRTIFIILFLLLFCEGIYGVKILETINFCPYGLNINGKKG
jgi:hypothetical protein